MSRSTTGSDDAALDGDATCRNAFYPRMRREVARRACRAAIVEVSNTRDSHESLLGGRTIPNEPSFKQTQRFK